MIKRALTKLISQAARQFPAVAIVGPRQSGKTTLVKSIFKRHTYVSLEDFDKRAQATADPRSFLREHTSKAGLILDEIQHAPHLLSYIQTIVDQEKKHGRFIITGSQNLLVNEAITQSLAGRLAIITLFPLSIAELDKASLLPDSIDEAVFNGSYPRFYAEKVPATTLYQNYIRSYIERDVRQLKNITNLTLFQKFVQLCAGRIGQVLNLTSLGNDCGIDHKTAQAWLSLLEATYVVFLLQPFYKNFGKRLIKAPKLYFSDTGIACNLLGMKNVRELSSHYLRGNLIENYVIADFFKQYYNLDQKPSLYFWRDHSGNEIDCVIETALSITPVEIKAGATINTDFFKFFSYWDVLGVKPARKKFVVYAGSENQTWPQAKVVSWHHAGSLIKGL